MENTCTLDDAMLSQLYELGGGTGALVISVIDAFLRTLPTHMEELRIGVKEQDSDAVRMASHVMKSAAANLGATEFTAQCQIIETLAGQNQVASFDEEFKKIGPLHESMVRALEQEYETAQQKDAA